jgi:perosamine synthetase
MIGRHQLAVAPRITLSLLARAGVAQFEPRSSIVSELEARLRTEFSASGCVLTDSGTSALVLALRLLLPRGGVVGLPGYGCVDITSAVKFAGLQARLYDIDPATLSPDLDSVKSLLERGVDALLVAHYYGYPADVPAVRSLASQHGVPVLEDAAQASGAFLNGERVGALGEVSVLSFGRGKGLFGGRGGALLVRSNESQRHPEEMGSLGDRRGIAELLAAAGQWVLGRPELYAIPASIPSLRLGEMVYHPAHEPRSLSRVAASLTLTALANEARDRQSRARKASVLRALVSDVEYLTPVQPIEGSDPGFLRFAVIDRSHSRRVAGRLGVMPGYPRTLFEQAELAPNLMPGEPATPGATRLRESLLTLPTHPFVTAIDFLDLQEWMHRAPFAPAEEAAPPGRPGLKDPVYGALGR